MDLTVSIRDAHIVHIDQRNGADTGTRQRFCRPGAYTADSNHTDMRVSKHLQRLLTI